MKILIADDEDVFRSLLKDFLKKDGYEVIEASTGKNALFEFQCNNDIDLVILDVMMPEMNGYEVCKQIKSSSRDIPVLILTAKDRDDDEIEAFESGADDYISKPFSFPILLLRVKALLKRNNEKEEIIEYENIKIDIPKHFVSIDGKEISLTPKEFELLLYLLKNMNTVLTRDEILSKIWGYDYFGDNRTVDTHIKNLRIKINDMNGDIIKTVRGYGYKIGK